MKIIDGGGGARGKGFPTVSTLRARGQPPERVRTGRVGGTPAERISPKILTSAFTQIRSTTIDVGTMKNKMSNYQCFRKSYSANRRQCHPLLHPPEGDFHPGSSSSQRLLEASHDRCQRNGRSGWLQCATPHSV